MAQKLKLSNLKVQSFVTALDEQKEKEIKGGMTQYPCTNYPCTKYPDNCTDSVIRTCGLECSVGCTQTFPCIACQEKLS